MSTIYQARCWPMGAQPFDGLHPWSNEPLWLAAIAGGIKNSIKRFATSSSVRLSEPRLLSRRNALHCVDFCESSVNSGVSASGGVEGMLVFRRLKVASMACRMISPSNSNWLQSVSQMKRATS